ncbi:MAG TPA: hypothetical protein DCS24_07330 [Erythrobacter sp.]|nr:hypothetical protein [Erythrobacter sp.]
MNGDKTYRVPQGPLCLSGPIDRPEPGTLPLRGDLAHIALAGTHLAAHYVIPSESFVGDTGAEMHLMPGDDSEVTHNVTAGTRFEVLDVAGAWVWGCLGPDGPSGYVLADQLHNAS